MTSSGSKEKKPVVVKFIIILIPFLVFYWMCPFIANQSIGQDYQTIGIQSQMELLFSIKTGSFPLYVPGYAFGTSSSTLTIGQVFHPLPHLASMLPGYWDGKALQWNTFLRLLSLGLTHLALFVFLRKIQINTIFSFLLSFITVYNLRMLDLFRYGASLEAYTAHLLLCVAIGCHFVNPSKYRGPLCIIVATYLLICSGHPQMMYYGLLGVVLFLLVIPFFILIMLPDRHIDLKVIFMFWCQIGFYLILGVILSSAYILPFYFDFLSLNAGRVNQGYAWSVGGGLSDTLFGTLNNFFLPFRSDVHGAFGGSSLFIMAAVLPVLRLFKVKIPAVIWITWGLLLLGFLHMQGDRTPLHRLVWEYLPFASSFRGPGRISLIMPIFIMLLLAWTVKTGAFSFRLRSVSIMLTPSTVLSFISLLLMSSYISFLVLNLLVPTSLSLKTAHFTPVTIRKIPSWIEISVILQGMAVLLIMMFHGVRSKTSGMIGILLCIMTLVQTGIVMKYGTWVTNIADKPTFKQMVAQKKNKLDYRHHPGSGLYSTIVETQIKESFMEPYLGKIFTHITPVSSIDAAYSEMRQERLPQQVFIEGYESGKVIPTASNNADIETSTVELVYSSFNRLKFRVVSAQSAFFGLSYPYTGHWKAWLNGNEVHTYRANGAAHAVSIPKGESVIEVRYWSSAAFWGMILSCGTLFLIGLYICFYSLGGLLRVVAVTIILVTVAGGFMIWYHSLYTGDNLGTEYTWIYEPPTPAPNIAYGKKTSVSFSLPGGFLLLNHSSRAVDGNRAANSGFSTSTHDNPFWIIDLYRAKEVKSIILYESKHNQAVNMRPLVIAASQDGKQWQTITTETSIPNHNGPTRILLEKPQTARYIQIKATGYCSLKFDEIEIYGPETKKETKNEGL